MYQITKIVGVSSQALGRIHELLGHKAEGLQAENELVENRPHGHWSGHPSCVELMQVKFNPKVNSYTITLKIRMVMEGYDVIGGASYRSQNRRRIKVSKAVIDAIHEALDVFPLKEEVQDRPS